MTGRVTRLPSRRTAWSAASPSKEDKAQSRVALMCVYCFFGGGVLLAQGTRLLPANLLIPQPPPSAPLSDWIDSSAHAKIALSIPGGAELRGWDYKLGAGDSGTPLVLFSTAMV
jgi:hypothetical protein